MKNRSAVVPPAKRIKLLSGKMDRFIDGVVCLVLDGVVLCGRFYMKTS